VSNRGILAGAVVDGTDWKLPAVASAFGNGTNTVVASGFSVLPATTCSTTMTNPHPVARLLVLAEYGAWLIGNGATGDVRVCLDVTGSLLVNAGIGGGGPIGWGEVLYATATSYQQHRAMCTYELPVSGTAATFAVYAMRNGSGTVKCDYPVVRITPLRYFYDQGRS
jgi:hypothetical protein